MAQESTSYLDHASGAQRWPGTARYEVTGTLGEGGMGVVYEAFDRERQQLVAVKTLLRFDAAALYLFKQEFRTLADVRHSNLVRLFDLVVPEGGHPFFTMELVRGVDFRTYALRESRPPQSGTTPSARPTERETVRPRRTATAPEPSARRTPADVDRLRPALRQLAAGVHALHTAGKLHRDIKPSNILVTGEGRVVLLDFGVATELSERQESDSGSGEMVGTARYMAPEQACDEPPSFASDWYSVGVVLYEALVGRPPFMGSAVDVLTMKTTMDPVAPSSIVEGVPADLDALCVALLARESAGRPGGDDILRRLGVKASEQPPAMPAGVAPEAALVGRDAHLLALHEALEVVRRGRSMAVRVSGAPGMGKSTVAHAFLDAIGAAGDVLVLRSRAYEREAMPYKAIDSAVDALSKHLLRLADRGSPPALPEDTWALARLFPVLQRVPMPKPPAVVPVEDPQALRRRAVRALMLLLGTLSAQGPVVLFIDDAQWGDVDSAGLVLDLLRSPEAPPVLLLMTHRAEGAETNPFLAELRGRWPATVPVADVDVGPLTFDDAQRLAMTLLGSSDDAASRTARAVARESRGSPFLVEELVRSNRVLPSGEGPTLAILTLDQMVSERLDRLSPSARALLEVAAVGGRPLPVSVAAAAAGSRAPDDDVAVGVARRFLRTGLRDGRDVVEITHDRIRETIVGQLSDESLREHHRRLATALQETGHSDAEAIATHWLLAGDRGRAAEYAESAAEQAAAKLAFDQAARLMRLAIDHAPPGTAPRHLRIRLGELLKNCGRSVESARVFQGLVEGASKSEQIEYQRVAAEQLLVAGCIDEGAELLHRVLRAAGIDAPRSPVSAVFWLLVYRLWLAVLGLRIRDRRPDEVPPEARARIEALFTATSGFSIVDVILSACMQARHLVEALRYGDRFQLLRAVSLEAAHLSAAAKRESARERKLLAIARDLVAREGTLEAEVYFSGARGIGLFQRGRWREAAEHLERGQKGMLHALVGFSTIRMFAVYTGFFVGEISESHARIARLCADADDRGDRYTGVNVRTSVAIHASLANDDVEAARKGPGEALALWTQKGFHVQHWQAMVYGPEAEVYAGDGAAAYDRLARDLGALDRSLLLHAGFIRAMTFFTRGRYAIASLGARPELRRARVDEALKMARLLAREADPWTGALAEMVRACAYNAAGHGGKAVAALRLAIEKTAATDCLVYLETARYRLGQLLGGQEGRELRARALEAMAGQGVKNPDRWAATFMPGTWEPLP